MCATVVGPSIWILIGSKYEEDDMGAWRDKTAGMFCMVFGRVTSKINSIRFLTLQRLRHRKTFAKSLPQIIKVFSFKLPQRQD